MTNKRIFYTRSDGGVNIVTPTPEFVSRFNTEAEALAAVQAKDIPSDATVVTVMDVADIPKDRTFRDAWVQSVPGTIITNMPMARHIHTTRMADARDVEITRLKIEEPKQRLDGATTQANKVVADRAVIEGEDLSLLAIQIQAAPNPVALKAIWPTKVPR